MHPRAERIGQRDMAIGAAADERFAAGIERKIRAGAVARQHRQISVNEHGAESTTSQARQRHRYRSMVADPNAVENAPSRGENRAAASGLRVSAAIRPCCSMSGTLEFLCLPRPPQRRSHCGV